MTTFRFRMARVLASALFLTVGMASAQSLNWEGQTGIFVTPLAYTAASPNDGIGRPIVAYHYLDAGDVLGGFHTASTTVGVFGRAELGYTRMFHQSGDTPGLSPLWNGGFNVVHAKVKFVPENVGKHAWMPAVSAGFAARTQVGYVSGALAGNRTYNNGDFYVVATKTVTQTKKLPLVLNFGYKATNASVLGLAGNAPAYKGRAFGAGAFVLKGPAKSTLIFGSEFAQQPREVRNLPGAVVPTTLTYAARIIPSEKARLNLDCGIAQAAGEISPGVFLHARHQVGLGISYGF